jgi:hypothetical protein
MTRGLEGRRSVQLSYGRRIRESGRPDSNRGPPAPKAGALPNCATPRREVNRARIEPESIAKKRDGVNG